MKKWIFIMIVMLMVTLLVSSAMAVGDVKINKTNFPDAEFRAYVKNNFDTDGNGVLSQAEIRKVQVITVGNGIIKDMTGLQYFINLEKLSCYLNQLTSLNVSKNTKLMDLDCSGNELTSLDVSNNTRLTNLDCGYNDLTSLDVTKNTNLTKLNCELNQLTSLNVSKNTKLTHLDCTYNELTSLDVSKCTALTQLQCSLNELTSLDISKNTKLTHLFCFDNQLTSLNVSKNTKLTHLDCSKNHLTSLDVSNNTGLYNLFYHDNHIDLIAKNGKIAYKSLPGFKIAKASNIVGAKKGTTAFIVTDTGEITYTYNIGLKRKATFTINVTYLKTDISTLTIPKTSYAYTGSPIEPAPTVKAKVNGKTITLKKDTDYTVTYKNNTKAGTASVTVKGIGHYTGTITKKFTITPVKILKVSLSNYKLPYTGKARKPMPTVTTKVNGQLVTLTKNTDYTVKYENNIEIGTATVTIAGKGNYTGTITKTFTIE